MSSTGEHHSYPSPAVPPSLSAGDHGMRGYYDPAQDNVQRPRPNTVQNITPYLGLRSRLSQVWINRWTVLLFLVLVRVLIAIAGLNHDLGSAKSEAMSACTGVESMGSAMASMPHYLSSGVSELAASGIEKAVHGLMSMLLLTITGVEELVVFYINMLTSTYMCLITLAVSSSLHVALKVIEDVSDFLNKTLKDISSDIGNSVTDFQNGLNKFTSALDSVPKVFGGKDGDIPKVDLSSEQKALIGLQLPSGLDQNLTKLNNSIPTFQDVQNFTDNVIRFPFEEVKKLVNGYLKFDFNRSLFPVPQKEQLTFCSDNNEIGSFFDDLANLANDARKIFIAVLVIMAIAVCIPMAYQEIRRYRKMQQRTAIVGDNTFDPMDVIYITSRPYTATAGIKASAPFGSTKRQALVRWVIAYATSAPALFVLTLGVTGLFSCLLQYLLLRAVEKEVPALANEVGAFADKVVDSLNNASASWANGTNAAILDTNNGITHDILGWVNTTTGAVNGTLNTFIEKTTGVLNDTFGGTILYEPITGIFECLIGLKVAAVQKGLTWVSDEAKVNFPLLPNDTFSLGAAASIAGAKPGGESESFLANPGQDATDKITGAVERVTSHIADSIRVEAIVSTCVVLVWVIILLFAILRAIWLGLQSEKNRAEGGPAPNDGIPMQDRPCTMMNGPAPAYEPPKPVHYAGDNPFSDANYAPAPPIGQARSSGIGENDYQDHKLGFGGLRQPAREESPTRGQRNSIYPILEKS